jgi:ubiquitin-like-conjugating enzyme ATG3
MKVDDEKQPQIKGAIKKLDSDDEDDAPPAPKKEEITEAKTDASHSNNDKRYYDISITYDRYHHTPRLWLSGLKNDSTPLTNEEIFEDIMSDYAHKTVTIEEHPHLGTSSLP